MTVDPAFLAAFDALPLGGYGGSFDGRRWRITKTVMATGRSHKLEAEELGGAGYISANIYRLANGAALLKPCEVPVEAVEVFVRDVEID